jgi:hypothetical protein
MLLIATDIVTILLTALDQDDGFWVRHKGDPFPVVAEAIEGELAIYSSKKKEIDALHGSLASASASAAPDASEQTAMLMSAVSSMPELLKQKAVLDAHMVGGFTGWVTLEM